MPIERTRIRAATRTFLDFVKSTLFSTTFLHADCRDHTVEDQADAADGAAGHGGDDRRELRAEGEAHGKDCRDADDARVVDLAERQNAGVFAVGGVGRRAEEGCERRCQTVAHQGAVQARDFQCSCGCRWRRLRKRRRCARPWWQGSAGRS